MKRVIYLSVAVLQFLLFAPPVDSFSPPGVAHLRREPTPLVRHVTRTSLKNKYIQEFHSDISDELESPTTSVQNSASILRNVAILSLACFSLFLLPESSFALENPVDYSGISGIWDQYNNMLELHPILTKSLTSLTGFTIGDVLAQKFLEPGDKPFDIDRTLRMGSFGLLLHGTLGHYFYGLLDAKFPGTAPITVATKVTIDQTIASPLFGFIFFGYLNFAEGKSWDDYVNMIRADLKTSVLGSWSVWVPAHAINFALVPPSQRLLYINVVQIGYNIFLSFLGNKQEGDEKEQIAVEEKLIDEV